MSTTSKNVKQLRPMRERRINQCRSPQEPFSNWKYDINSGHYSIFGLAFKEFGVPTLKKNGKPRKGETPLSKDARLRGVAFYVCWSYPSPLRSDFRLGDVFILRGSKSSYVQVVVENNDDSIVVQFGEFGCRPQKTETLTRKDFLSVLKTGKANNVCRMRNHD